MKALQGRDEELATEVTAIGSKHPGPQKSQPGKAPSTAAALNSVTEEDVVALSVSWTTISFGIPESCESPSLSALYGRFQKVGASNKDGLCVGSLYVTFLYLS